MDWDQWVRIWTLLLVVASTLAFAVQTGLMWRSIGRRRQALCVALGLYQAGVILGLVGRLIQNDSSLGWGIPLVWAASVATGWAVIRGAAWKDEA